MNVKAVSINNRRLLKLSAFAILLVFLALGGWRWMRFPSEDLTTTVYAQQDAMLDRRISQVEQRFYYLETRLDRLESASRYPSALPGSSTASQVQISQMRTDLDSARAELDSLRSRIGEVECGLLKVDERTLTPAARQRRRSAQGQTEPCRANPDGPITLSARP
jgi:hypothetical protein